MKATKDNATYTEKIVLQDDGDSDFMKVTNTTVGFIPNELNLVNIDTNILESFIPISSNNNIVITDTDKNIFTYTPNSVDEGVADSSQFFNIFLDKNCQVTYNFNGNVDDLGGKYNANWNGNEQYDVGKFDQSASFDGSSMINGTDIENTYFNNFSVSVWVKTDQAGSARYRIMDYYNDYSHFGIYHGNSDDDYNMVIRCGDGSSYTTENTGITINDNEWHHVVCSMDNGDLNVYIDNNLIYTKSNVYYSFDIFGFCLGGYDNNYYYEGLIDQFRVFNKVLTEDEVDILYNEQVKSYIVDISSLNITEPSKAFFNQKPIVMIAIEDTQPDITDDSFSELTEKDLSYDGEKFTLTFDDMAKDGRAIQRKIVSPKEGMQILEPFTSNLYKKDS